MLCNWRASVCAMLRCPQPAIDRLALMQFGDALQQHAQPQAAHVCHLLAGVAPCHTGRLAPLIGCSFNSLRSSREAMIVDSLQLTEVYEYSRSLSSTQDTTSPASLPAPQLLVFELVYAYQLIEQGDFTRALAYLDRAKDSLLQYSTFREALHKQQSPQARQQLASMQQRLASIHPQLLQEECAVLEHRLRLFSNLNCDREHEQEDRLRPLLSPRQRNQSASGR